MKIFPVFFLILLETFAFAKSPDYLPVPTKDIFRHTYYILSYNESNEQANWVYYSLTDSMVLNSGEERGNNFKIDKLITTGSAKSSDYTKSGYDRGHLCPAADMGFNPVAMEESFLMSNISPQTPDFNRGIWKELETTVRKWALKEHQLFVVTGPIFKNCKGSIGKDNVKVPGYFFKVIYDPTDDPKMIAFVFPNQKSDHPLTDFVVPTDEVEQLTGLDFFSQLPDGQENKLEGKVQLAGWFTGYEPESPIVTTSKPATSTSEVHFYLILVFVILLIVTFVWLWTRSRNRK
jgi:endonuclease G, mitochondrial